MCVSKKIGIILIVILIVSIGLNIYNLLPVRITGRGAEEREEYQKQIDSLLCDIEELKLSLVSKDEEIDSIAALKRTVVYIKDKVNDKYENEKKNYNSLPADSRVNKWSEKSRE